MRKRTKKTVLVEDEAEIREFASTVVELEGYRVLQTGDADEGMRLLKENQVSLILLDLRLTNGDGWAILEQLKKEPELSSVPVVIFTALAAASQKQRAQKAGATAYLVKPLSYVELSSEIARVIHKREH